MHTDIHTHTQTHTQTHPNTLKTHTQTVICITDSFAVDKRHLDLEAEAETREEWFHIFEPEYRLIIATT